MNNFIQEDDNIALDLGATVAKGVPAQVGVINVVPLVNAVSGTLAACKLRGVVDVSVTAVDDMGNAAVAKGDKLYLNSGVLNVDAATGGTAWGYALEAVTSGSTSTINVLIGQF